MPDATEVRARLWEWQSFQGFLFIFAGGGGKALIFAFTWRSLTPELVVINLLTGVAVTLAVALPSGLWLIPRVVVVAPDSIRLEFRWRLWPTGQREFELDDTGSFGLLSHGWFGAALRGALTDGRYKIKGISFTKAQARLLEGRIRKQSWFKSPGMD